MLRSGPSAPMPHAGASSVFRPALGLSIADWPAPAVASGLCRRSNPAHQLKPPRQHLAQRRGVGVGRGDEAQRLDTCKLEQPPPGVDCAARLVSVEADELGRATAGTVEERTPRKGAPAQLLVLEAVLGDRVAGPGAFVQPARHLRRALPERVQVASGYHEQRDPVHAVVVEPIADQSAALERGGLDVM